MIAHCTMMRGPPAVPDLPAGRVIGPAGELRELVETGRCR